MSGAPNPYTPMSAAERRTRLLQLWTVALLHRANCSIWLKRATDDESRADWDKQLQKAESAVAGADDLLHDLIEREVRASMGIEVPA